MFVRLEYGADISMFPRFRKDVTIPNQVVDGYNWWFKMFIEIFFSKE